MRKDIHFETHLYPVLLLYLIYYANRVHNRQGQLDNIPLILIFFIKNKSEIKGTTTVSTSFRTGVDTLVKNLSSGHGVTRTFFGPFMANFSVYTRLGNLWKSAIEKSYFQALPVVVDLWLEL